MYFIRVSSISFSVTSAAATLALISVDLIFDASKAEIKSTSSTGLPWHRFSNMLTLSANHDAAAESQLDSQLTHLKTPPENQIIVEESRLRFPSAPFSYLHFVQSTDFLLLRDQVSLAPQRDREADPPNQMALE